MLVPNGLGSNDGSVPTIVAAFLVLMMGALILMCHRICSFLDEFLSGSDFVWWIFFLGYRSCRRCRLQGVSAAVVHTIY